MSPAISVIVPVYNTGKYLEGCLESILGQTLKDIELICVDDLSTDDSPQVLRSAAEKDPRVKVVTLKEKGFDYGARNEGISHAAGKYLYFMDSDDRIDPDYLERMLCEAERTGAEVVTNASWVNEYEGSEKKEYGSFPFLAGEAAFYPSVLIQAKFPPIVWARLYSRDFVVRNSLEFPAVPSSSDVVFASLATLLTPESYVFKGPLYHYLQRQGSLMKGSKKGLHDVMAFDVLYDELSRRNIPTRGVLLYYMGPVTIDTPEEYGFLKRFFTKAGGAIRSDTGLYAPHDLFVMDAVMSTDSYEAYLERCGTRSTMMAFIKSRRPR